MVISRRIFAAALGASLLVTAGAAAIGPSAAAASGQTLQVVPPSSSSAGWTFDYTSDVPLTVGNAVYLGLSGLPMVGSPPPDASQITVQDNVYGQEPISNVSWTGDQTELDFGDGAQVQAGNQLAIMIPGGQLPGGNYVVDAWNSVSVSPDPVGVTVNGAADTYGIAGQTGSYSFELFSATAPAAGTGTISIVFPSMFDLSSAQLSVQDGTGATISGISSYDSSTNSLIFTLGANQSITADSFFTVTASGVANPNAAQTADATVTVFDQTPIQEQIAVNYGTAIAMVGSPMWINNGGANPLSLEFTPSIADSSGTVYIQAPSAMPDLSPSGITAYINGQAAAGAWNATDGAYEITGVDLKSGVPVDLTLDGLAMPTAGSYTLDLWTSDDLVQVPTTLSVGAVQNVIATASNPVEGEFSSFTASFAAQDFIPAGGSITVGTLPAGVYTTDGTLPASDVVVKDGQTTVQTGTPSVNTTTSNVTVPIQSTISAGDQVSVEVGVYSDFLVGQQSNFELKVATSSDPNFAMSPSVTLTGSGGSEVSSATFTPFTQAQSGTNYSTESPYTITFTPGNPVIGGVDAVHVAGTSLYGETLPAIALSQAGNPVAIAYESDVAGNLTIVPATTLAQGEPVTLTVGSLDGNEQMDPRNPAAIGGNGPVDLSVSTDTDPATVALPAFSGESSTEVYGNLGDAVTGQADAVYLSLVAPTTGSTMTLDLSHSDMTWSGSPASTPPTMSVGYGTLAPLAAGSYTLDGDVLTIDASAFSGIAAGAQIELDLPLVNGAAGTGYITVQTSDTAAPNWFGYNVISTPNLTASSTDAGASDTLSLQFQLSLAQSYYQGNPTALQFDVSDLVGEGVQIPSQVELQIGSGTPQVVAANVAQGTLSVDIPQTILAGESVTLSFAITNPNFMSTSITVIQGGATSNAVQIGTANFSGTVEDASGSPIANATLNLMEPDSTGVPPSVTTDSSGDFAASLGAGTYVITGFQSGEKNHNLLSPITIDPAVTPATGLTVQASAHNVTGQLTTPNGLSNAGAEMLLDNDQGLVDYLYTSSTGAIDGTLPPGTWYVFEMFSGNSSVNLDPETAVSVPASGTATLDLTWPNINAEFTVSQSGTPEAWAYVVVAPYANGQADVSHEQWLGPTDTSGDTQTALTDGTYEVMGVAIGEDYVDLTGNAQTFTVPTSSAIQVTAPAPNLDLTLNPNGLEGGSASVLAYAQVEVAPDNGSGAPDTALAQWLWADGNGNVQANLPSATSTWYVLAMATANQAYMTTFAQPIAVTLGTPQTIDWPASLTVTLETGANAPVANQQVTIAPASGSGAWITETTDANGQLVFDEQPGTSWKVLQYGDVDLWGSPVTFQVPTSGTTLTVTVPSPTLSGTVLDASGNPVADAWVSFLQVQGGTVQWSTEVGTQADAAGDYGAILGTGTWQAMGYWDPQSSTYVDLSQDGLTANITLGQTFTLKVQSPPPNFSGTVTRAGTAFGSGQIILFGHNDAVSVQTDTKGDFSAYVPASQTWTPGELIAQDGAQYYLGSEPPLVLPSSNVTFSWPAPDVTGQVTNASGQGLGQAVVYFAPTSDASDSSTWQIAVTGNSGDYGINLAQGDWTVVGVWAGTLFVQMQQNLTVGSTAQTVNLSVTGVNIKVEDASGQPVPNAVVDIEPTSGAPIYLPSDGSGLIQAQVPSGSYTVVGYWPQNGTFVQADTTFQVPASGSVTVQPVPPTPLQITINGSTPTATVEVLLQNAQGDETWYATDASGKLTGVPDGGYGVIEVTDQSGDIYTPLQPTTVTFTSGSPSPATVDVQ